MLRPLLLPCLLGLLAVRALAQNPTPAQTAAPPQLPSATGPLPATVRLQFPNADVQTIFDIYENLTRKRLIRPNQVLMGQVYLVINEELPREEAVKLIEMTLLANGFSLIPTEDPSIIKVFGNGVSPRTSAIPIISDPALLPVTEQVVTYIFNLQHADPTELATTMQTFIQASQAGYTQFLALPKSHRVLVTETTPNIRSLMRLVSEIDLPPAQVISRFIPLERADAKDIVEKLEKLFEKQPTQGAPGTPGSPASRTAQRNTPEGNPVPPGVTAEPNGANSLELRGAPTLSEDSVIVGKIKITADVRTNRIHVLTRPVNIPFIEGLIQEFDRDVPFADPVEFSLKFVTAADILDSIIKSIQDPGAKDQQGSTGTNTTSTQPQSPQRSTGGFGNDRFGGGFGGGGMGGGGGAGFGEELQTQDVNTKPVAVTVGNTRIVADNRAGKIIVLGNKEICDKIGKLLKKLDVRPPQVSIHTVIGQLELKEDEQFGVDYFLHRSRNDLNSGAATPAAVLSGRTLNLAGLLDQTSIKRIGTAGSTGLSGFLTAGNTLTAFVTALESTGRFHVVSRPHVFTSNNKKALITSGKEIAVPTNTLSSLNNGGGGINNPQENAAVSSSVAFKRVALQLEVVPTINSDREVSLDIVQLIDELTDETTTVGGNKIPTISNRRLKSTVSVPNEGTLVLGGLISETKSNSRAGVPYLSKIPLLGGLFRNTTAKTTRSELVILMRPVVSLGPDEAMQLREREQDYLKLEPNLESTLYPVNTRRAVPANTPVFRSSASPTLRPPSSPGKK